MSITADEFGYKTSMEFFLRGLFCNEYVKAKKGDEQSKLMLWKAAIAKAIVKDPKADYIIEHWDSDIHNSDPYAIPVFKIGRGDNQNEDYFFMNAPQASAAAVSLGLDGYTIYKYVGMFTEEMYGQA